MGDGDRTRLELALLQAAARFDVDTQGIGKEDYDYAQEGIQERGCEFAVIREIGGGDARRFIYTAKDEDEAHTLAIEVVNDDLCTEHPVAIVNLQTGEIDLPVWEHLPWKPSGRLGDEG